MNFRSFFQDVLFVVVLYRQHVQTSVACTSLFRIADRLALKPSLFLHDNSPSATDPEQPNVHYVHDPLNPGVSRAYNRAADVAQRLQKKWMLLLDQDTELTLAYLEKLFIATEAHPHAAAFVPKLHDHRGPLSPFAWRRAKGHRIKTHLTTLPLRSYRFINSGLFIQHEAFQKAGGYDENIPLDFSDIAFGERLMQITPSFIVVDEPLLHGFSGSLRAPYREALARFEFFCRGARGMAASYGPRYLYFIRICLRGLALSVIYRKGSFIRTVWKSWEPSESH